MDLVSTFHKDCAIRLIRRRHQHIVMVCLMVTKVTFHFDLLQQGKQLYRLSSYCTVNDKWVSHKTTIKDLHLRKVLPTGRDVHFHLNNKNWHMQAQSGRLNGVVSTFTTVNISGRILYTLPLVVFRHGIQTFHLPHIDYLLLE